MSPNPKLIERLRRFDLLAETHWAQLADSTEDLASESRLAEWLVQHEMLTDFQAKNLLADKLEQLVIGRFRLLEPIGAGGQGQVYRAVQIKLNRIVAIKLMRSDITPESVQRFRREALAVARLSHPNIVQVFDADDENGTHFIATEYVRGTDLARLVSERGPLPMPLACDFIRQTALGLEHAHANGLIHRDVKPSNLLVSFFDGPADLKNSGPVFGPIKILDLGLARSTSESDDVGLTRERGVLGTPDFISPEQARDARLADVRSDLYSLGCTFYFLLAGQPPFPDGTAIEKVLKHQLDIPTSLNNVRPDIVPGVDEIVKRLMKKHPDDRFQSAGELARSLLPFINQGPKFPNPFAAALRPVSHSKTPSPLPTHPAWGDRLDTKKSPSSTIPPPAGGVPEGLQQTVFGDSTAGKYPETQRLRRAQTRPSTEDLGEAQPYTPGRLVRPEQPPPPITAPPSTLPPRTAGGSSGHDSSWSDFEVTPSESGFTRVMVPHTAVLAGHKAQVVAVAFAPSGDCVATAGLDHGFRIWRLDNGLPIRQAEFADSRLEEIRTIAFTPGGDLLISATGLGGRIWLWRWRESGDKQLRALDGSTSASALAISPDGKVIVGADGTRVLRWSMVGTDAKWCGALSASPNEITNLACSSDSLGVFAGDAAGEVQTWRIHGRRVKKDDAFRAHHGRVNCVAAAGDNRLLATSGSDNIVRVWDLQAGPRAIATVSGDFHGTVRVLRFLPAAEAFMTVSDMGQVARWKTSTGEKENEWRLKLTLGYGFALDDRGGVVAAGFTNGNTNLYHLPADPDNAMDRRLISVPEDALPHLH